jgi:hypothetical protein
VIVEVGEGISLGGIRSLGEKGRGWYVRYQEPSKQDGELESTEPENRGKGEDGEAKENIKLWIQ